MTEIKCKACGNDEFFQGRLGNGFTMVTPLNKLFGSSRMILTFCSKCGEVTSIKIENPKKFK